MPKCLSPDTKKLSSQARHLFHSTQPDKYRAFLLKDSSDEETSSEEEEEQTADDELQKPPACRFIDVSKRMPSDDYDDDGNQESSADESLLACQHIVNSAIERIKAASSEDLSSGDDMRGELCSILVDDQKQSARPERAFALTAPCPKSKKRVRFDCQEDLESEECELPPSSKTKFPARGGDKSDVMDSINLKCMKSIKRAYPKLLQPPRSYRTSVDKLKEFVNLTHPEKWAARTDFQKMSGATKQSFSWKSVVLRARAANNRNEKTRA